jgi:predicted DCC family thiol-disulfide oxidoreductase YuxK
LVLWRHPQAPQITTMKTLDNKLIIYDSNCKVCSFLRSFVLRFTAIPESKIKSFNNLDAAWLNNVDTDKFRNGMALLDTAGGKTIYGTDGIAYIFSSQYKIAEFFFKSRIVRTLFNALYKTTAYNRYIMATPKSKFECDCFPDKVAKYRLSYIAITVLISIVLTALFGITLKGFFPGTSALRAAIEMLLIAGTGWVLQIFFAVLLLKNEALDYVGHLGTIMVAGLMILVPSMLFYAITGILNAHVPLFSVLLSSATMLYLHRHRVMHLKISSLWTVSWFMLLQSTAAFWVYFFHIKWVL